MTECRHCNRLMKPLMPHISCLKRAIYGLILVRSKLMAGNLTLVTGAVFLGKEKNINDYKIEMYCCQYLSHRSRCISRLQCPNVHSLTPRKRVFSGRKNRIIHHNPTELRRQLLFLLLSFFLSPCLLQCSVNMLSVAVSEAQFLSLGQFSSEQSQCLGWLTVTAKGCSSSYTG